MVDINKQNQKQAEAAQRNVDAGANLAQQGLQAGVEAARRTGGGTNEIMYRSAQAAVDGQRQIVQDSVEIFEEVSRKVAEGARSTSEDMRQFFVLPRLAEGGLRDVQQGMSGLVEGMMRVNLRTAQELFRLANPTAVVELQQRFAREYMDVLMQGTATLVRAVRRTADEALNPLEEQVQQRRQGERYRNAAE